MPDTHWAICPWVNSPELTWQAVIDLLAQTLPVRVLLIDQGASREDREWIDAKVDALEGRRVLPLHWNPPVPSLSACWNRALRYVWEVGGTEALVVNNDCKFAPWTYERLYNMRVLTYALFVSAVGVREAQFAAFLAAGPDASAESDLRDNYGGPDFSCFLLSRAGHKKYPFDEQFIPAYHEDLDMHRRYMLGWDGDKIFSVNLPFLHYASGTIKDYTPEQRQRFNKGFAACKAYYTRKWGGGPNEETFRTPFGTEYTVFFGEDASEHPLKHNPDLPVTTPDLQRYWQISRRPTDV